MLLPTSIPEGLVFSQWCAVFVCYSTIQAKYEGKTFQFNFELMKHDFFSCLLKFMHALGRRGLYISLFQKWLSSCHISRESHIVDPQWLLINVTTVSEVLQFFCGSTKLLLWGVRGKGKKIDAEHTFFVNHSPFGLLFWSPKCCMI